MLTTSYHLFHLTNVLDLLPEIAEKKNRIKQIGKELFDDGGVDALENFFFALSNRIKEEFGKDIDSFKPLWNDFSDEWKY